MSKSFALAPAVLAGVALVSAASPCLAQSATDEIEMVRTVNQAERKAIVAQNMNLSDSEGQAFWPVYNEYETAMRDVNDRRVKVLSQLASEFEALTDDQALKLLREHFEFQEKRIKVRKSYVKKFEKVLSGKQVTRFYQIDNKIDTMIDFDISRGVPLVD